MNAVIRYLLFVFNNFKRCIIKGSLLRKESHMSCYIAHSEVNGQGTIQNIDQAIIKGFAMAHKLASDKKANLLVFIPKVQDISAGRLSSALGQSFVDSLKKQYHSKLMG